MKYRNISLLCAGAAVCATALTPAPAAAQAWIGQMVGNMIAQQAAYAAEVACMTGTPMVASEVTEARGPAEASMARYWAAVQGGQSADVSGAFHVDKKARWASGTQTVAMAAPASKTAIAVLPAVTDPFAAAGGVLDIKSGTFFRAGDGQSARGQWTVRTVGGKRVGTYEALFTRKSGDWRMTELTLRDAATWVDPLVQYCHKIDDVLPYRVTSSEAALNYARKQVTKGEAKLVKAEAAAAKPRATPEVAAKAVRLRTQLAERRDMLAKADAENAAAKAEQAQLEKARTEGRTALAAETAAAG